MSTLCIMSWNIDGLDEAKWKYIKENYLKMTDILFLQETKRDGDTIAHFFKDVSDTHRYIINAHSPSNYHGVAALIKKELKYEHVNFKLGCATRDDTKKGYGPECGRVICIKVGDLFVLNTYVPYSGAQLQRLRYRVEQWDKYLFAAVRHYSPIIWLGDINVAPQEKDVSHPIVLSKRAGFTPQERQSLNEFLKFGAFVDIWRQQHPSARQYTFRGYDNYHYRWRLDNCIVSENLVSRVTDSFIVPESKCLARTDHVPIGVEVRLSE